MSIHQTKTGQWFVAYRRKGERSVRREYFGHGPEGKLEAKKWEAAQLDQARRAGSVIKTGLPSLTFYDLSQRYLSAKPLAESTQRTIRYAFELYVFPLWGRLAVAHLSMAHLVSLDEVLLKANLALATRNRYRAYCRAVCQWGYDNDLIPQNPFAKFRADVRKEGKAPDLVTTDEVKAILAAAPPHLRWAIEVIMNTGLRSGRSELFAVKISDIDFARQGLWIARKKTDSDKTLLPLLPQFLEKIRHLLKKEPGRQYLVEYECSPVTTLKTAWSATKKKAGITRRLRLYDFRHWYASTLLASGADLKATSELLGHASVTTTMKNYYHLMERQKREALNHLTIPSIDPDSKEDL